MGGGRGHIPSHELTRVSVRVLPNGSFLHTPLTSCQTGVKFQIVNQRDFFQRQSPEYDLSKSCSHTDARNHSFSLCPHGRQKVWDWLSSCHELRQCWRQGARPAVSACRVWSGSVQREPRRRASDQILCGFLLLSALLSAEPMALVWRPKRGSWNSNCAVHKSLGNGEGTPS